MAARLDTSPQTRLRHLGNIGLATRAQNLTTEERISKCASNLAHVPDVLDVMHASLGKVLSQPHNEKYRKINICAGPFKEKVASKSPAVIELLYAVGYEPMHGFLVLQRHESRLLSLAIDALEAARSAPEYVGGKAALENAQVRMQEEAQSAAASAARRAAHLAAVPAEPTADGASSACVITVKLANFDPYRARVGTRRFSSDNTLDDLMHYIRSLERVPESEGLVIENVTTRPARVLDPSTQGSMSLYALDLWPRAQVQVSA